MRSRPTPGDAAQEGADAAAEPGAGDRGAGAAGLDGEAADGEGEAVGREVEAAGAGDVDQVVALARRRRGGAATGVRGSGLR